MNKLFTLFAVILCFTTAVAQRNFSETQTPASNYTYSKSMAMDTLGMAAFNAAPKAVYLDQNGGYAAGTNSFNDLVKAQSFEITQQSNIREVLFYFAAKVKQAHDSISYLTVAIYAMDGSGISSGNTNTTAPGRILHSRKLLLDSIDTIAGHFTRVRFDWAPTDSSVLNFAVGIDLSHLDSSDKVALLTTKDSNSVKKDMSWEKRSNGQWQTMLQGWPLDLDFAIFPIVDPVLIGVNETTANTTKLSISPNPANDFIELNFALLNTSTATLKIADQSGKIVYQEPISSESKSLQKFRLNTSNFNPGVYSLSVITATGSFSKKLVILHQ